MAISSPTDTLFVGGATNQELVPPGSGMTLELESAIGKQPTIKMAGLDLNIKKQAQQLLDQLGVDGAKKLLRDNGFSVPESSAGGALMLLLAIFLLYTQGKPDKWTP